jgi:hypothetical protein
MTIHRTMVAILILATTMYHSRLSMNKPRRAQTEKIEDAFADLSLQDQKAMLETLAKMHRWAARMQIRADIPFEEEGATSTHE